MKEKATQPPPTRNWFKETIKLLVGVGLLIAIIWFWYTAVFNNPGNENYPSVKVNKEVSVYKYKNGGITYLVFISENKSVDVINYTADSIQFTEYLDYERMIKDTTAP